MEFLKGFGPLAKCVENVKAVVSAEWFFGFISSAESNKFLETQPVGTFLIRFSGSRPGAFVLDYVLKPSHIRSVRLISHPDGGFAALIEGGSGERTFKTLNELIETYQKINVLSYPFSSSLPQKEWFFGDLTSQEAEKLLKGCAPGTFLIRFSKEPGCFAASYTDKNNNVQRGLITRHPTGYQVSGQGMIFKILDDLVHHYKDQGYFTLPFHGG